VTAHLEDLVRAAQERQATRAPDPDRIRSALPARAARLARRRYGMAAAVAAAVAVALAVTVPAFALRGAGDDAGLQFEAPPPVPTTPADAASSARGFGPVGLCWRPTWLPNGLEERIRRVSAMSPGGGFGFSRTWTPGPVGADGHGGSMGVSLYVRAATGVNDPQPNDGEAVDINGTRGYYHGGPGKAYVEWRADAETVVTIDHHRMSLDKAAMLRIARSVRADPGELAVPLTLGWLPGDLAVVGAEVSGDSPAVWLAQLTVEAIPPAGPTIPPADKEGKEAKEGPRYISVSLSPTTTAPAGGEQVTVGGRPGRFVTRPDLDVNMLYLVVELADGRLLTVIANWPTSDPLTRDDLLRVAAEATPGDPDAAAWVGDR
jgi:hypothetical protein